MNNAESRFKIRSIGTKCNKRQGNLSLYAINGRMFPRSGVSFLDTPSRAVGGVGGLSHIGMKCIRWIIFIKICI